MNLVDVVVIDDDEGICWILQQALSMCNVSCSAFSDARRGIESVSCYHPQLAIVDIKLGAINGFDVARQIHQIHDDVKILYVTGYKEALTEQIKVGGNVLGMLEKPFDVAELLQLVKGNIF